MRSGGGYGQDLEQGLHRVVCGDHALSDFVRRYGCAHCAGQGQQHVAVVLHPGHGLLGRRYNGVHHIGPGLFQSLLHHRQRRLRQFLDVWQHIGSQLGQEVGAQVFDLLDGVFHGAGLLLEGCVRGSHGCVHFRRFAGEILGLRSCQRKDGGFCFNRRKQVRKGQFVAVHALFQNVKGALQALTFQKRLAAFIAHFVQGVRHAFGRC